MFNYYFIVVLCLSLMSVRPTECVEYDEYLFVIDWPASFYKGPNQFTIHGLWPKLAKSDVMVACPGTPPYNHTLMGDLLPEMTREWPSMDMPNIRFWAHEWQKHGTCTTMSQYDYFKATLALKRQLGNLTNTLAQQGIALGTYYQLQQIKEAFKFAANNCSPQRVMCTDSRGSYEVNQLQEVGICVDKNALAFKGCKYTDLKSNVCPTYDPKLKKTVRIPLPI